MPLTTAVAGGAALLGNVIGGLVGANQQNKAIDKQIAAQKAENAATREHNLQLAHLQNSMNIDQWKRENKYNSPAAQMARFQAAGLNPNLIYGQSNTSGQISGSLTSGAPATPTDMSALGNKRSGLASAFKAVGDAAMQIPMYREQVRGMKLDNDMKQDELWNKQEDTSIRKILSGIPTHPEELDKLLEDPSFGPAQRYEIRRALYGIRQMSSQTYQQRADEMMRKDSFKDEFDALCAKYSVEFWQGQEFIRNFDDMVKAKANQYRAQQAVEKLSQIFSDGQDFKGFLIGLGQLILNNLPKLIIK